MGAVACAGGERIIELSGTRIEGVEASATEWLWVKVLASRDPRVDGINVVIPGFEIKELFELIELGRILRGEVVRFGVIGGEIVEFPMVAFRCLR